MKRQRRAPAFRGEQKPPRSSCPASCRASTSYSTNEERRGGRDKLGHDENRNSRGLSKTYFDNARNMVDGRACRWQHGAMKIHDAAKRLEALGNQTRLRIYRTLVRAGNAGMPVGRLQEKLKVAPSTLSHHV